MKTEAEVLGIINALIQNPSFIVRQPALVENTMELLDAEIPRFKDKVKMLHLCFTTDPFMYEYPEIQEMSMAVIKKMNDAGIKCSALTKGVLPIELAQLSKENEYGITLVSLDDNYRQFMEPGAAPLKKRLAALKNLQEAGCRTWVSMEPYPTPNIIRQDLKTILETVGFADKIIFGRTNYSKIVSSYKGHKEFYNEQAHMVIDYCEEHGMAFHIKKGTLTD